MRTLSLALAALLLSSCTPAGQSHLYHVAKTVSVPGEGGWDYVTVDTQASKVYVTHTTEVDVLDAESGARIGVISDLHGAHGVALAPDLGRGFITNGKADKVTVFNLGTLEVMGEVKTGSKPDSILYDTATRRVFAFNGENDSATVIDAARARKVGTIALKGAPEFAASDDEGHIFVNLEDKNELLRIDAKHIKVLNRWPVAPGASPSSLAIDRANHRLFLGCRNKTLIVMDATDGQVIATLPLGDHVDATAYDAEAKEIISSNGDGTLTIVRQDDPDHYRVADTIVTQKGSRTFGLDDQAHRLFVPAAKFTPAPAATSENPEPRPGVISGTFKILVLEK